MHPEHSDPEQLLDYVEGLLPREEEARLEAHLDVCEACRQRARQVLSFSAAWDEWAREGLGPPNLRAAVTTAFLTAEEREPPWRARLAHWRERWARLPLAAGRVIVAARDQVPLVIAEGFGDLALAMPSGGGVRTRGGTFAPSVGAEAIGRQGVRVDVSGSDIIVHMAGSRPGPSAQAPLAMLVPTAGKGVPVIQESRGPKEGEFVAWFEGVEPGDYIVVVEPAMVTDG
jgi:anti-sigma factor RsiW